MASPTVIPSDLPTIMQAVETQLLTYVSPITQAPVCGDISNIYWLMSGDTPPQPANTGQRDVLLAERADDADRSIVGGGRIGAWVYSGLDVYLRSSYAVDRVNTRKQWMITHARMANALLDALMTGGTGGSFYPQDAQQNALTIEGFVWDQKAAPVKNRDAELWGYSIATFRFHYVPNIAVVGNP